LILLFTFPATLRNGIVHIIDFLGSQKKHDLLKAS
jgi:hypothetical protein